MPKKKSKDWKQKNFSLDTNVLDKIPELAKFENMSESEFIEFLVLNWDSGINPEAKLNSLMNRRKEIAGQLNQIENEIKETSDQIMIFNDWKKQKLVKRADAIKVLEGKIMKGEFEEAERISKVWQRITGITSLELLMEAKENAEKSGR